MEKKLRRCGWSTIDKDLLYMKYHDEEWGVPVHDDKKLFEFLALEGAQAGLSWLTILRKRENYRKAFDHFDPQVIAEYGSEKIRDLVANEGIIRNRLKIVSTIQNAKCFLRVQDEFGSFDKYIWSFVPGSKTIINHWSRLGQIPARTKESGALSRDLKSRGFKFVGSIICYAHMQATGMVNDHLVTCFRYKQATIAS